MKLCDIIVNKIVCITSEDIKDKLIKDISARKVERLKNVGLIITVVDDERIETPYLEAETCVNGNTEIIDFPVYYCNPYSTGRKVLREFKNYYSVKGIEVNVGFSR